MAQMVALIVIMDEFAFGEEEEVEGEEAGGVVSSSVSRLALRGEQTLRHPSPLMTTRAE